jgi:molecular chaperone HscC
MIVGIDLGTTNSAIGIFENGRPRLLPNSFGQALTPSVVGMGDKGTILVGQAAKDRLVTHPAETQSVFKRYMGTNRSLPLGRQSMRAEELSSLILKSLKQDAETALGTPVSKAVISVPAYFSNVQREATKLAGQLAGLEVVRLINEPTAAAMAYSLHEGEDARQFLVCDLGGGTFDVSILDYFDGVMEVKASTGDTFLGGEDFTRIIYEAMLQKASKVTGKSLEFLDNEYRPSIFPKAERLKIELTSLWRESARDVS